MSKPRSDGRSPQDLRPVQFLTDFTKWAEGSVLACFGDTKVLCTATVEDRVPQWMKDQKAGWITAEYAMLPRSTDKRNQREAMTGKVGGRTHEISRLIGRSLRAVVDTKKLGERTVTLDCDVIQADGGTRTAAITGAWVALRMAFDRMIKAGTIEAVPMRGQVAAVSLGVKNGEILLDLSFEEDSKVDTDLNLVMTAEGGVVELQATAEREPFTKAELDKMLEIGRSGIERLVEAQRRALEAARR
jgi:ribonuclease PH